MGVPKVKYRPFGIPIFLNVTLCSSYSENVKYDASAGVKCVISPAATYIFHKFYEDKVVTPSYFYQKACIKL